MSRSFTHLLIYTMGVKLDTLFMLLCQITMPNITHLLFRKRTDTRTFYLFTEYGRSALFVSRTKESVGTHLFTYKKW